MRSSTYSHTHALAPNTTLDKKKRTIPEIRGEKNAVPSCDIMLDDAHSAQGKSRGQARMTLPCVDRASSSMISQDRTAFFSPRISRMVLFFAQGILGAVANYRHFVSNENERCSFELKPPPPNEYIHCMHMEKCWPRNAGIVYMMRYTWWCLALRSILGKSCDVPGSTEGHFSCFFLSGVGAYRRGIRSAHYWER